MKNFALALVFASLAAAAQPMFADAVGSTVTGGLFAGNNTTLNLFDPNNNHVPSGASNGSGITVTLGAAGTTFQYLSVLNGLGAVDGVTAVFTGDQLSIHTTDVGLFNGPSYDLQFTDDAFLAIDSATDAATDLLNHAIPGFGDTSSLIGNTLDVKIGAGLGVDVYTINLGCSDPGGVTPVSATPEPGSIALLGTGLLGVAGVARRRIFA